MSLITEKKFHYDLPSGKKKERLDLFLTNQMENATRNRTQKLIEAGCVLINGKAVVKSNFQVNAGDSIEVTIPISPRPEHIEAEDIPIVAVYEDEYLLVVNKPAGMVVHPAYANYTGTLVNALLHHSQQLSNESEERPGIVHRIDKDTSGLLVVAKDEVTHAFLSAQFAKHSIEREYYAICWGRFKEHKKELTTHIGRSKKDRKKYTVTPDEGRIAITHYEVIEEFDFASMVKVNLKTGRTHQIRVHMSYLGHPIFGDEAYGGTNMIYGSELPKMRSRLQNLLEMMPRQALHARTLGFIHPHTKEFIRFESELPEDMQQLLVELRKTYR